MIKVIISVNTGQGLTTEKLTSWPDVVMSTQGLITGFGMKLGASC